MPEITPVSDTASRLGDPPRILQDFHPKGSISGKTRAGHPAHVVWRRCLHCKPGVGRGGVICPDRPDISVVDPRSMEPFRGTCSRSASRLCPGRLMARPSPAVLRGPGSVGCVIRIEVDWDRCRDRSVSPDANPPAPMDGGGNSRLPLLRQSRIGETRHGRWQTSFPIRRRRLRGAPRFRHS